MHVSLVPPYILIITVVMYVNGKTELTPSCKELLDKNEHGMLKKKQHT